MQNGTTDDPFRWAECAIVGHLSYRACRGGGYNRFDVGVTRQCRGSLKKVARLNLGEFAGVQGRQGFAAAIQMHQIDENARSRVIDRCYEFERGRQGSLRGPVLIVWAREDKLMPPVHAQCLMEQWARLPPRWHRV